MVRVLWHTKQANSGNITPEIVYVVMLWWFLNSFPLGELEETSGTPLYYMDEDYPARPETPQPLPEWSSWRGLESSTLWILMFISQHHSTRGATFWSLTAILAYVEPVKFH